MYFAVNSTHDNTRKISESELELYHLSWPHPPPAQKKGPDKKERKNSVAPLIEGRILGSEMRLALATDIFALATLGARGQRRPARRVIRAIGQSGRPMLVFPGVSGILGYPPVVIRGSEKNANNTDQDLPRGVYKIGS